MVVEFFCGNLRKRERKLRFLCQLLRKHDVVVIQEAHVNRDNLPGWETWLKTVGAQAFVNVARKRGAILGYSVSAGAKYDIRDVPHVMTSQFTQRVDIYMRAANPEGIASTQCCYFSSSDPALRISQIRPLRNKYRAYCQTRVACELYYKIWLGDFTLLECKVDMWSASKNCGEDWGRLGETRCFEQGGGSPSLYSRPSQS